MKKTFNIPRNGYKPLNDAMHEIQGMISEGALTLRASVTSITPRQMRSLHLWFSWCVEDLNNAGIWHYDDWGRREKWTPENFKSMFRKVIYRYQGLSSVRELPRSGLTDIVDACTEHIMHMFCIELSKFPSKGVERNKYRIFREDIPESVRDSIRF